MKLIATLIATILFATSALAADKPEAALAEWKTAVEAGNVDAIMKLYDKNAVMISTFAQEPLTKRKDIEGYFKKVVPNPDIKVDIKSQNSHIYGGDMAIINGRYDLSYTQDGDAINIPARFTFVYALENGKWMIVDQHSSRVPLPDEEK